MARFPSRWARYALAGAALLTSAAAFAQAVGGPESSRSPASQAERLSVATSIVAREEAASGREFDPRFRAKAVERLAGLSDEALLPALQQEDGLGLNGLGDTQADLVYTPVTPCRIVDTRLAGGPLAAGFSRSFKVTGDTTFQGGAKCDIPFGPATSAMVNFVAVDALGRGNMQITPFGQALPTASIINYASGFNVANGLAVALCDPSATTCTFDVTIQANNNTVHLVADVQGYFQRVSAGGVGTALLADGAVTAVKLASGAVTSAKLATGAVTTAKVADGAVTSAKIGDGAVGTASLADGAVTSAKLSAGAVGTSALAGGSVTGAKLADGAVTSVKLAAGAVTASLDCTSTVNSANVSPGAGVVNIPNCPAGYTITGAGCRSFGTAGMTLGSSGLVWNGGNLRAFCTYQNDGTFTVTIEGTAQCCRVVVSP